MGKVFKWSVLSVVLSLFSLGVFANPHLVTKQQIGLFKNSKTCIVLETGSVSYNVLITDAVQEILESHRI